MPRILAWSFAWFVLALSLCLSSGCTQSCFTHECDKLHYDKLMPPEAVRDPQVAVPPLPSQLVGPAPATVSDPEKRKPHPLTLHEAIATSLEHGTTGIQSVRLFGNLTEDLLTPSQAAQLEFSSDSIRVLALEPAIKGAAIEASLSRDDAKWVTQTLWSKTDQQVNGQVSFNNGDRASVVTDFVKPLPTGGLVGFTMSTTYQNLSNPPAGFTTVNPSYLARTGVFFEQPLWQSFGVDINQLLNRVPGISPGSSVPPEAQSALSNLPFSSQQGNSAGFGTDGILISRLRFDQSRCDFERALNFQIMNVEAAYWNLYAAYINLYAADQGLRMAHAYWEAAKLKREAGGGGQGEGPYTEDRARGQFFLFKGDRIQALGQVLEAERVLRTLMGVKVDDGEQLIPVDTPVVAPYKPNWECALEDALTLRPELIADRQEYKLRQLDLELQKNFLKPDLRFVSGYDITGLGNTLTGNGLIPDPTTGQNRPANAFRNLATTNFSDWNLGLTLTVPLGYRFEHASIRRARLALAQAYWFLKTEEKKAESFLTKTYRDIETNFNELKDRRLQRDAFAKALEGSLLKAQVGGGTLGNEEVFQAQRDYVNALRSEAQAMSAYNISLAAFQFAKGTLLRHDNIQINEDALPQCAQVRAVEHERERGVAIVTRERPIPHTPEGVADIPDSVSPSVPALMQGAKVCDTPGATPSVGTTAKLAPPVMGDASQPVGLGQRLNSLPASGTPVPGTLPGNPNTPMLPAPGPGFAPNVMPVPPVPANPFPSVSKNWTPINGPSATPESPSLTWPE